MTVWPYLLGAAALSSFWNWRAALMFALAIGVGQATTRLDLSQAHLLAGYTLLAVVATFLIDMYSGLVLALFGLTIGLHMAGFIGHTSKVIAGEIMLIMGMLFCGYNGPSGGIWASDNSLSHDRRNAGVLGSAPFAKGDALRSETLK